MSWSRWLLRVQRRLLRGYEFFLIALLLALVVLAAWPEARAQDGAVPLNAERTRAAPRS